MWQYNKGCPKNGLALALALPLQQRWSVAATSAAKVCLLAAFCADFQQTSGL